MGRNSQSFPRIPPPSTQHRSPRGLTRVRKGPLSPMTLGAGKGGGLPGSTHLRLILSREGSVGAHSSSGWGGVSASPRARHSALIVAARRARLSLPSSPSQCNPTRPAPPHPRLSGDFLLPPAPPPSPGAGPGGAAAASSPDSSGPGFSGPAGKRGSGGGSRAGARG